MPPLALKLRCIKTLSLEPETYFLLVEVVGGGGPAGGGRRVAAWRAQEPGSGFKGLGNDSSAFIYVPINIISIM